RQGGPQAPGRAGRVRLPRERTGAVRLGRVGAGAGENREARFRPSLSDSRACLKAKPGKPGAHGTRAQP
ncbi:MAG: hypothetical protein AAGG06_17075, partial [Pseudomonadota bacterium]